MRTKVFFASFLLLIINEFAHAQNTNSIYSAYGIGDVNIRDWNAYTSMGGLGVALKSERTLNDLNPASYGGLQNHRFLLELAANGTNIHYVSADNNISGGDLGIKRAAFGMNLFKNLGTVFGLRQYSNVGYQTTTKRFIEGTNTSVDESINGTGGLNLLYMGNGYNIGKHLSLGVSTGVLFGSVNQKELINITATDGLNIETNNFYNKLYLNTGIQYQFKTGKYKWLLGGTFQPAMRLNKQATTDIKDLSDKVLQEAAVSNAKFSYPLQVGAGITLFKGASKFGVDYIRQNWGSTNYRGTEFTSTNLQNAAIGYSYSFYRNSMYGPVERVSLMLGLQRDLSYIILNGEQVSSTIGTLGINVPSKNGRFNYSFGLRVGQRGKVSYPLVKEKFVDFTFNISLGDIFYIGGRKYD